MNVLLVTHYYASHRGGVEILADTIARGLVDRHGIEITWAAGNCDAPPDEKLKAEPIPVCNFTENHVGFPYPIWWNPLSLIKLWKLIGHCSALHIHDILYHGNVLAFLAAKLRGKPVLLTQHVSLVPYKNPMLRYGMRLANTILGNVVLRYADRVIMYSEQVRAYFASITRKPAPELVPNGIDTDTFSPADAEIRSRLREMLQLPSDASVALFVGRFVEKKGLKILEQVVGQRPEVTFVFCGWGPLDPEAWDRPNVRVVRDLKSHELVPYYRAADLFVLPSVGEGFPVVVQEAMASGLPVLVSTATADAQPAVKDAVLHVPILGDTAADAARVANRIAAVLADRSALEPQRTLVAEVARREWSWPRCIDRYAAILRELVMEKTK